MNWRGILAGCQVTVHQHLDGTLSLTRGPRRLGRYTAQGVAITATKNPTAQAVAAVSLADIFNLLRTAAQYFVVGTVDGECKLVGMLLWNGSGKWNNA